MKLKKEEVHAEGFTLLEVMIASALFTMAILSILGMVTQALEAARRIQKMPPDAGSLAAQYSITNIIEEGSEMGDFGELYPDYAWTSYAYEVGSNGLFQIDFVVQSTSGRSYESMTSMLLYKPGSKGSLSR